eukprot:scaffold153_cov347-Pavlova_lutheri.AAC.40
MRVADVFGNETNGCVDSNTRGPWERLVVQRDLRSLPLWTFQGTGTGQKSVPQRPPDRRMLQRQGDTQLQGEDGADRQGEEFLDEHEIDFVAHDALPYADASGQADDVYGMVKKLDRFVETQRTDGISTSDLILRIIKNYNDYVMRNLARGYTRKDLGISYVKEKRVRAASQIRRLSQKVREQQERMGKNLAFLPKGLRQNSQFLQFIKHFSDHVEDLMDKFVAEFGHEMQKNAGSFHRNADRIMTGFFREVEEKYQNWEKRLTSRFGKRFSPRI